jgi:hypothetical protein
MRIMDGFSKVDLGAILAKNNSHDNSAQLEVISSSNATDKFRQLPSSRRQKIVPEEPRGSRLAKSLDLALETYRMIEEKRSALEEIDFILLKSRSVGELVNALKTALTTKLGLVTVRFLFRNDHDIAQSLQAPLPNVGLVDDYFDPEALPGEYLTLQRTNPLVFVLFEADPNVSSTLILKLPDEKDYFGLLCLAAGDTRYSDRIDFTPALTMAQKIALAFINVLDHQTKQEKAFRSPIDKIYTEPFFLEVLNKQLDLSWRTRRGFSLMAIKLPKCAPSDRDVLLRLVSDSFRSSDIVANSDSADLWVLFPDTDAKQAQIATDRLLSAFQTAISGRVTASVGITEFSRNSVSISAMLTEAVSALQATSAGNPVNVYEPISDLPVA